MKTKYPKIKTIDVHAKEWFDKTYGNSYFSMNITINYGMKNSTTIYVPMQYGYGDYYRHEAFKELQQYNFIPKQESNVSYWRYYEEHNIIARHNKQENCRKREL